MNLILRNNNLTKSFKSESQKIRVLTENWVDENIYCPGCGNKVNNYENNKPVADFYCSKCNEDYELKSKKNKIGKKIVDGAYSTMIKRLYSKRNPNFFFLTYNKTELSILNFLVIPKHFFIPEIIEKRKPLSLKAKRAGWIGCNILLNTIPESGKIYYIKNNKLESKNKILDTWNKMIFLRDSKTLKNRGWLIDIIQCIEKLGENSFTLNDIYFFESYLKLKHPNNKNIKAKIRQQLQFLRDKRYLDFTGRGKYKIR